MLSYINWCNKWYCPNNLEFTVYIIRRSVLSVTKNILTCLRQPWQLRQDNDMVDHTPKVPQSRHEKNQPNHTLKNLAYICLKNMSHKATCMYSLSTPPPNHPLKPKSLKSIKKKERKKKKREKKAEQFQNMIAIFNLIQCPVNQGHQWGWSKIHLITEKRGPPSEWHTQTFTFEEDWEEMKLKHWEDTD